MDISPASAGGAALGGHSALLPFSVLDVNDENPTFFPAVYNVSLPENVARDFKVVRLNCTDADIGLNAELSYFITGMNPLQSAAKGSELSLWKGARQPPDLGQGVLHISTPFSSPSKACTVSPSAEQPRLAPCFADRSTAVPCPARGEPLPPSIPCHLATGMQPGKNRRMGLTPLGWYSLNAHRRLESLSGVLGHLVARRAGGFGWARSRWAAMPPGQRLARTAAAAPAAGGRPGNPLAAL